MIFLGGLPRSGSTLLANIFNQNPDIHATETSGLLDIVYPIKNGWNDITAHQAIPNRESGGRLKSVLSGVIDNYHADTDRPIIIDKNRGWLGAIEMLDALYGDSLKVIVMVRDIVDILASIELRYRDTNRFSITTQEKAFPAEFVSVESRLAFWLRNDQFLGSSFNLLKDVMLKRYDDRVLLVEYRDLCAYPAQTMTSIYGYLEIPHIKHDFENVEQITHEDDRVHGFSDLHTIRERVEPNMRNWKHVLGEAGNPYLNQEFWRLA